MWESWSDLTDRYRDWFANRVDASEDALLVSERGHARTSGVGLVVIGISITAIVILVFLVGTSGHGAGPTPSPTAVMMGVVALLLPVVAVLLLSRHLRSRELVIQRTGSAVLVYRSGLLRRTFRADVSEVVVRIYAIMFENDGFVNERQCGYVLSAQVNDGFICLAAVPREEYGHLEAVIESFPPWIRSRVQHSLIEVWLSRHGKTLGCARRAPSTPTLTDRESGGPGWAAASGISTLLR